ncbi:MAG: Nif3-like dinuclear metal center hexameric protein [Thermodesulfobacteriota bacterium]|nr:Nif3-like dinuclear metal center hexameric protein [Thermodesulfobacteriota bacterium]
MTTRVRDVIQTMEAMAPVWMRYPDDPIGLHAGHPDWKVKRVLLALDATLAVVREAKKKKCQMLITHHPRFYRPLKNLDESQPMGALAAEMARARLALYCAHTNLDVVPGGVNDILADLAGMGKERAPMVSVAKDPFLKLVTFVPESHVEIVRKALCSQGAGVIGQYRDCSFRTAGIGTFRGSSSTKPYVGKAEQLEEVKEWRLEVLIKESESGAVLHALREKHPYEEPAYDLYLLHEKKAFGQGRVGLLKRPTKLQLLARKMKKATGSPGTLVLGDATKPVQRVGVWSGSGFRGEGAAALALDAIITGEIDYHTCELLEQVNTACIVLGHGPCEQVVLPWVAENLQNGLPDITVEVAEEGVVTMWSA